MQCPRCRTENRDANLFCVACGVSLSVPCPNCGLPREPGARFCGGCGTPLTADGGGEPSPPAPSGAPSGVSWAASPGVSSGERRQVTILFADLCGFTPLSRDMDAEELHGLVGRFFETADGIVAGFGGTVDKHIGDAVMALFGAPIAHGDDPLRAVRAALEIHDAMAALSDEFGRPLRVHIGIASGEVVAAGFGPDGRQGYTVLGESVNLAARLVDEAGSGETLVSDKVHRAVSAHLDCEALGALPVKGLDRPVRTWRIKDRVEARPGSVPAAGARSPFVGREADRRQFAGLAESCRETGRGQVVFLRGEAGIGKTRLLEEFQGIAEHRGFASHKGLVLDFGVGKGQDAIRALVRSLLGISLDGEREARGAAAERAQGEGLVTPDQRVFLNDLLDLPQPTELRAMYDAMDNITRNRGKQAMIADLIAGVSGREPSLLIVEDIHWADAVTLANLAAIAAAVKDCAALLVMTSRLEGDPLDQAWRAATLGSPLITIDLGPLRKEDAITLAGAYLDATNRIAMTCIERAEGNPLFLEQLLHNAEESAEESVPASIQSLILGRIDRLFALDKRAVQAASVLGQRFGVDALRQLLQDPVYVCTGLVQHYLVRPEGDGYLFAHALIQEGVYASLLNANRRVLHRRAAAWFAERDPILWAQHLDRAEDPAAPAAYLAASRLQATEHHYERALQLVDRGLAIARSGPDQFALTCLRGELLHDLGSIPESLKAYRRALEIAADDAARCQAWIGLAAGLRVTDGYEEAFEVLDRAEKAAARHALTRELAHIHHLRGNLYFPLGRIEDCRRAHEAALGYARGAGLADSEARALSGLGDAAYASGRMKTAHGYFKQCVELCRAHGFGRTEVASLSMVGFTRQYFNEFEAALDDALASVEAAVKVGHHRAELLGLLLASQSLHDMADFARMRDYVERAQALVRSLGAWRFEPQNLYSLAAMRHAGGNRLEALELLSKAVAISRETGLGFAGARVLGQLALVTEDPAVRRQALAEGEAILSAGAVAHNHFWFYRNAIDAALDVADWDGAERYAASLEAFTHSEPLPWCDFLIARGRALAGYGRGRREDAVLREIRRLRDEACGVGFRIVLPALERALVHA